MGDQRYILARSAQGCITTVRWLRMRWCGWVMDEAETRGRGGAAGYDRYAIYLKGLTSLPTI